MTPDDPLAFRVFNEIGIIDQLAGYTFAQVLPGRMTLAQFTVLNHFVRLGHEWRTPAQLAGAFQVSRPTMTSTLSRLEREGLVVILPDPDDGRGKRVSITDKGYAMREECIARLAAPLADVEREVPLELLEQLLRPLSQLRQTLDRMRD